MNLYSSIDSRRSYMGLSVFICVICGPKNGDTFKPLNGLATPTAICVLLDQTRLPSETVYLECRTVEEVWQAIKRLSVRGRLRLAWRRRMAFVWG